METKQNNELFRVFQQVNFKLMAFETPWQREKNSNENFDLLIKTKLIPMQCIHSYVTVKVNAIGKG